MWLKFSRILNPINKNANCLKIIWSNYYINTETAQADEFLDMVAGIQGSRMNDQRAAMPKFPGLHNSQEVLDQLMTNKSDEATHLDDGFFEMLMRCQV